jgi:vitamin B12 transporter
VNRRDDENGVVVAGHRLRIFHPIGKASARAGSCNPQESIMRGPLSLLSLALISLAAAAPAQAADTLEAVVVTATRTPQPAEKTGDSISVITDSDLETQQIVSVADALEQTPGLEVVRNGGVGQTTTVSIRGAESGQTLVLVDGVRINDPSTVDDEAVLGDLLANNIDRIEILRGPQSTLYGSDAIGGVVNILTRRGGDMPFALRASAEGGSFDSYRMNAAANGTLSDVEYGAAANFYHSNGISAADSRNGNPETDGYTNLGLTANVRAKLSDAISLDLRSYYTNSRDDFDDNFIFIPPATFRVADSPVYGKDDLLAGYAGLNISLFGGRFSNRFAVIGSQSNRRTFDSPFYLPQHEDFFARGHAARLEYQGIVDVDDDNQITFGAESQRITLDTGTPGFPATRGHDRIDGAYAQAQSTLWRQLTLTGGIRFDHDQEFGGHTSLKLAAAWLLNGGTTVLRGNYGDGFKAPTLYELFSEFNNPNGLAPETAHGWEAGFDQALLDKRLRLSATYFDRRTRNLIEFFDCFSGISPICAVRPFGYYYNVGSTEAHGLEMEAAAHLTDALSLSTNLTDMSAVDLSTGNDLARRPQLLANLNATWTPEPGTSFGAGVGYVGRRFDDANNAVPLASHATANLFASHDLNDRLELYGRIENLFAARYEPVFGYGAPGRAFFGGLRASY